MSNPSFEVLSNIPITKRTGNFGTGREAQYPLASLEVGQTLFVAVEDPKKQRARASYLAAQAKKLGLTVVTRTGIEYNGKVGVGLWRLADATAA